MNTYTEKIIKEFNEIQKEWELHRTMNTCSVCDSPKRHTDIKDFITNAITQQREGIIEVLDSKKENPQIHTSKHPKWCCACQKNQAIDDIIKEINK